MMLYYIATGVIFFNTLNIKNMNHVSQIDSWLDGGKKNGVNICGVIPHAGAVVEEGFFSFK
jgi:hypothetical protein